MADQMVKPDKGNVLITGASSFVGFRTVVSTLEAGYSVLAAVPHQEDADCILAAPSIKQLKPGTALSFIMVPDIADTDSLKEAVKKGFTSIIHCDNPQFVPFLMPADQWNAKINYPLIRGTNNVLSAAMSRAENDGKSDGRRMRVVITSSVTACVPYSNYWEQETFMSYGNYPEYAPEGPFPPSNRPNEKTAWEALANAKFEAMRFTRKFLAESSAASSRLSIVNLMPTLILGHDELAKTTTQFTNGWQSANLWALRHLQGEKVDFKLPNPTVHIDDVAKAHTVALDRAFKEFQARKVRTLDLYLSSDEISGGLAFEAQDIVKRDYMDAVNKGWLSLKGEQPINRIRIEALPLKTFGFEFAAFEEQIKSMLDQFVALKAKEERN
ncbi:MAG: hypothetical protein LQ337_007900 [Flavoplaca oasis]|nr:MAG: hypothetical protein LQ337_007900 [Flavoplaca oasis]